MRPIKDQHWTLQEVWFCLGVCALGAVVGYVAGLFAANENEHVPPWFLLIFYPVSVVICYPVVLLFVLVLRKCQPKQTKKRTPFRPSAVLGLIAFAVMIVVGAVMLLNANYLDDKILHFISMVFLVYALMALINLTLTGEQLYRPISPRELVLLFLVIVLLLFPITITIPYDDRDALPGVLSAWAEHAPVVLGQWCVLEFLVAFLLWRTLRIPKDTSEVFAQAASKGSVFQVRRMFDLGSAIDQDGKVWNALHAAIEKQRIAVVRLLVERGADIEKLNAGMTPLAHCVKVAIDNTSPRGGKPGKGPADIIVLLLTAGAKPEPALALAENSSPEMIDFLKSSIDRCEGDPRLSRQSLVEDRAKRRLQKRRRIAKGVLAVVLTFIAAFGAFRYTLHYRLETKLASIRAQGYPATGAELDAWYPTPTGRNAADVYKRAFDVYVEDDTLNGRLPGTRDSLGEYVGFPAPGEPLPADMAEAIEAHLAQNVRVLAILAEAVTIRECRFPVDLTQGIATLLPHLSRLRECTHLLMYRAMIEGHLGQDEHATESIKAILALADPLRNEPTLISQLVRIAIQACARLTVERRLGQVRLTDEQLAYLSQAFADSIDEQAMLRAVAGERATGLGDSEMHGPLPAFAKFIGLADVDRLAYLRGMDGNMALAEGSIDPLALRSLLDRIPCYRMVAPNLSAASRTKRQADSHTRTVLVGLAAKRYQLAHDTLPKRLDELVPEYLDAVPTDPFDGKPLRYKHTDTGAIVYSVGEDGLDDGGKKLDAQGLPFQTGTDIVFNVLR